MTKERFEEAVKACYSTWSGDYYDKYYGDQASYPPVHRDLMRRLLVEGGVRTVLDAGCGPASFLRDVAGLGLDLYGFDLTPEMIEEARRVMTGLGLPAEHVWEGSVLDRAAYRRLGAAEAAGGYDAVVCGGVLPHIPETADAEACRLLAQAARPGGLVVIEARNQLFALFTQNRYSYEFFAETLIRPEEMKAKAGERGAAVDEAMEKLQGHFRMDLPPRRTGEKQPGYDEILSRTHNPFVLRRQAEEAGLRDVKTLFYHYHCLPPMYESAMPELFRQASLAMEDPEDWRGHFMASAFLVVGRRA